METTMENPDVVIQAAVYQEREAIYDLLNKNSLYHLKLDNQYYHDYNNISPRVYEHIDEAMKKQDPQFYVAKNRKGEYLGFVSFSIVDSTYFDNKIEKFGCIYELFVEAKARGMGVGHKLIRIAEEYTRKQGCEFLQLQASTFNKDTLRFYENYGFVDTQRIFYKKLSASSS